MAETIKDIRKLFVKGEWKYTDKILKRMSGEGDVGIAIFNLVEQISSEGVYYMTYHPQTRPSEESWGQIFVKKPEPPNYGRQNVEYVTASEGISQSFVPLEDADISFCRDFINNQIRTPFYILDAKLYHQSRRNPNLAIAYLTPDFVGRQYDEDARLFWQR